MNILILAAGDQAQSPSHGDYPLWLAESGGETILERKVEAFQGFPQRRYIFAFRRADLRAFHLDKMVDLMAPGSAVVEIAQETEGAACTALLAISEIDLDEELIITSATDIIDVDLSEVIAGFKAKSADAGIITFEALHPRYSYVRCDEEGFVIEAAEKRPISRHASAGWYWFSSARDFFSAVKRMILKDAAVQGEFYICPSLNELILEHKRIATHSIATQQYHPIKAPQHLDAFDQALEGRRFRHDEA